MLKRFRLELILGFLLLATGIAVLGERWILKTSLVIDRSDRYPVAVHDDRVDGGGSLGQMVPHSEAYSWQCSLSREHQYPFCGFELIFDPLRQNGLDLSQYDRVRLWLDYEGSAATLRFYLRNFNLAYSVPGRNETTKYNQVEFGSDFEGPIVEFSLDDFFVANWWAQTFNVPPDMVHPDFSNIVVLELTAGSTTFEGDHSFQLERIEFVGQKISTLAWYQLIMATWFAVGVVFFGWLMFKLSREVRDRRQRERELVETNELLNYRSNQLEEMAKTDSLTGVFNREGIKDAISSGLAQWRQEGKPMALAILDIDHFKKINDTHGHAIGDKILTELSELIQGNIRSKDVFARWGGEEFVLICHNTSVTDAAPLAEKLRRLTAEHKFVNSIGITLSIGVAATMEGESLEDLFERSDKALYAAKVQGRDRVVIADENKASRKV